MIKSKYAVLILFFLWLTYEFANFIISRNIEVSSYSELIKKSEYGQITLKDLKAGGFDLIESYLCNLKTDELSHQCAEKFQLQKERCAIIVFNPVNLKGIDSKEVTELLRQFNLCRYSPVEPAT